MREILFRGKSVNDGNWVEGSLVVTTIEPVDDTPIKHYHIEDMTIGVFPNEFTSGLSETVNPNTVGQFTGLTDKNGKKIFEGDVVLYPWNDQDKPERFTIKFKDGQFVASPVKETGDYWDFMVGGYSKEMEVIGNIHDNPELLEVPNGQA